MILDNAELEFYKYDGDVGALLDAVRGAPWEGADLRPWRACVLCCHAAQRLPRPAPVPPPVAPPLPTPPLCTLPPPPAGSLQDQRAGRVVDARPEGPLPGGDGGDVQEQRRPHALHRGTLTRGALQPPSNHPADASALLHAHACARPLILRRAAPAGPRLCIRVDRACARAVAAGLPHSGRRFWGGAQPVPPRAWPRGGTRPFLPRLRPAPGPRVVCPVAACVCRAS